MKAWEAWTEDSYEGLSDIVFAETVSQAKQKCNWDEIEADNYIDIRVRRAPAMDDCENLSKVEFLIKALKTETYTFVELGRLEINSDDLANPEDEARIRKQLEHELEPHITEVISNEDFEKALHGNRSISLTGAFYKKGDYVTLYGKEFPYQYWIKCKIISEHDGKYKVKKGVRV